MKPNDKEILYCIVHNADNRVIFATNNSARLVAYVIVNFPISAYEFVDLDFIKLTSKNFTMSIIEMDSESYSIEECH